MPFLAIINSQVDHKYIFLKPAKRTFRISSFGICSDFRNMFAYQIINSTKLEGGCLIYLRKLTLGVWQSLYQHCLPVNIVLINGSYLVIKVGFVVG